MLDYLHHAMEVLKQVSKLIKSGERRVKVQLNNLERCARSYKRALEKDDYLLMLQHHMEFVELVGAFEKRLVVAITPEREAALRFNLAATISHERIHNSFEAEINEQKQAEEKKDEIRLLHELIGQLRGLSKSIG